MQSFLIPLVLLVANPLDLVAICMMMSIMAQNAMTLDTELRVLTKDLALENILLIGGRGTSHVLEEAVRALAVNGGVADQHVLLAHAQRHAADVLDEEHDERGPDGVPADDEQGADDLKPDLLAVAVDCTSGVGVAETGDAVDGGEETGQETTEDTGDEVSVRDSWKMLDKDSR